MSERVDLPEEYLAGSPCRCWLKSNKSVCTVKFRTKVCMTNKNDTVKGLVSNQALLLGTVFKVALTVAHC